MGPCEEQTDAESRIPSLEFSKWSEIRLYFSFWNVMNFFKKFFFLYFHGKKHFVGNIFQLFAYIYDQ